MAGAWTDCLINTCGEHRHPARAEARRKGERRAQKERGRATPQRLESVQGERFTVGNQRAASTHNCRPIGLPGQDFCPRRIRLVHSRVIVGACAAWKCGVPPRSLSLLAHSRFTLGLRRAKRTSLSIDLYELRTPSFCSSHPQLPKSGQKEAGVFACRTGARRWRPVRCGSSTQQRIASSRSKTSPPHNPSAPSSRLSSTSGPQARARAHCAPVVQDAHRRLLCATAAWRRRPRAADKARNLTSCTFFPALTCASIAQICPQLRSRLMRRTCGYCLPASFLRTKRPFRTCRMCPCRTQPPFTSSSWHRPPRLSPRALR